ncbi:MAG: aminopeptidase P family protein [Bdellovibrionales bacterium]|nr:aminopeptidase P family protein [Bdellovibrionales bacterium]
MLREKALRSRQRELLETLPDHVLVIAAGQARLKNITSSTYPFRASSTFLYFFGKLPPGSVGVFAGGESHLFIEEVGPDDVVWHGPRPSFEEYKALACVDHVKRKSELISFLGKFEPKQILALPTLDPVANAELRLILDRTAKRDGPDSTLLDVIVKMRLIQDEYTLTEIRSACTVTSTAFERGIRSVKPGVEENVIRAEMEYSARAAGFDLAFSPIVTVHGEVLHQLHSNNTARAGDILLVDFGAESNEGYASDVSRSWPVNGQFSPQQQEIYELVLHAQKTALLLAKPGIEFRELHQVVCETFCQGLVDLKVLTGDPHELARRGVHALFFPHGLGHLLGLDVHDMEDFGDAAGYAEGRARSEEFGLSFLRLDRPLVPGMVVTIEPGMYFIPALLQDSKRTKKFEDCLNLEKLKHFSDVRGIRIEDTILITEDGNENLTTSIPKEQAELASLINA